MHYEIVILSDWVIFYTASKSANTVNSNVNFKKWQSSYMGVRK